MFWQPTLDLERSDIERRQLSQGCWLDQAQRWAPDADSLFAELVDGLSWRHRRVRMYDRMVDEPRLVWWPDHAGQVPAAVLHLADRLGGHYGVEFDSISANWYRDGNDSVAWHADRVRHRQLQPMVAIVSLGAARPFMLRPASGGRSIKLLPASGDLLVMGGACQHHWHHCVPKVAVSGPRVSLMFRLQSDLPPDD